MNVLTFILAWVTITTQGNNIMYRFKQTTKFRVIVDSTCFYATAKSIRNGVGDFYKCNAAVQKALDALEFTKSGTGVADQCACGIAGTWEGLSVQLNIA
jgi:hypothetical protein